MRLTKAFGLAAVAVVAAMAFIGTSAASAQHEIVLCKALETLCAKGNLWPNDTVLLGLATKPELLGNLNLVCEDSLVEALTLAEIGNPLPIDIIGLSFGKLPTPTLGEGCTGCPFGELKVHVGGLPFKGQILVEAVDKYYLLVENGGATVLCGGFTCGYTGKHLKFEILHTGKHPNHSGENLPVIDILHDLEITSGSEFICGKTAVWHAKYIVYLAHNGVNTGLAWPSLDKKA